MKKLLTILFVFLSFVGVSQTLYPTPYTQQGSPSTMIQVRGGSRIDSTFVPPRYTDTLQANRKKASLYPGSKITVGNVEYFRSEDTSRWILAGSLPCPETGLISGSATWTGDTLAFDVTNTQYIIGCKYYGTLATTVILANADPTNPRIDLIIVDTNEVVSVLQGTPSANPVKPTPNPLYQLELTFVYVPAGSTTPNQVATIIYNENIEWASSSNVPSIDFLYPTNPYDGLVSTYFSSMASGTFISYQNGSLLNINNYQYLKFYFRRNSALGSDPASTLVLDFYNGNTLITNSLFINDGAYGYDASVIGSYQLITVPISSFTFADSLFDKLYITNTTGSLSSCQLDKIYLLGSVPPQPVISNAWVRNGNASTNPATDYVGTSDSTNFNIGTNGQKRLGFKADGIKESVDTTDLILVFNPVTLDAYYVHQPSIYALGCLKIYDSTSAGITRKYIRDTCSGGSGGAGWELTGNAGTTAGTNFIGTTDAEGLMFKVNNIQSGYLDNAKSNVSFGQSALASSTSGTYNIGIGEGALQNNTSGGDNVAINNSLYSNTTGGQNIAIGAAAMPINTTGYGNVAIGNAALSSNVSGGLNTIIGALADVASSSTDSSGAFGIEAIANTRQMAFSPYFREFYVPGITGSDTAGYVLTTNGSGIATFQPAAGGSSPWTQGTGIIYPTTITDVVGIGVVPTAGVDNGLLQISKTGGVTGFLVGTDVRVTGTSGVEVDNNFFSTSTAAIAKGIHAVATGTSSSIYGVEGEATATTSGNAFGISGVAGANTGDAIGGYFSATATDTTKAYGIYSAAGYNYFNGKVGIRNSHPDSVLTVIGGARFDNGRAQAGYVWTSTGTNGGGDWKPAIGTVTNVSALTLGTTGTDLSSSVANGTTTPVITLNVPTASASNRGALSSTDWSTFNNKQSAITFGTGVQTALGVNIGSAGAPILLNGAGGTPSSLILTNATGLPIAGTTGYGTGVATALAVATNATGGMLTGASSFSANVLTVLSDFRPTKTITAAGTTGAQTINKTTGTVNFAAGASTLVVTNSFAFATSVIIVTVYGTDATATSARVTKAAGSFTITLNAAATAETAVGFMVTN